MANDVHCEMYFLQRQRYFNENTTKILHCARLLLILQAKLDFEDYEQQERCAAEECETAVEDDGAGGGHDA